MKLKTKINNLLKITSLLKLEGKNALGSTEQLIDGFVLTCKEGKISTKVMDKSNLVFGKLVYNNIEIIEEGILPVGNVLEFEAYLKRFNDGDEVTVEVKENKIEIARQKPKKIASIPLTDAELIDDTKRGESIKLDIEGNICKFNNTELNTKVEMNSGFIRDVLDDASITNIERSYPFIIKTEGFEGSVGDVKGGMIISEMPTTTITRQEGDGDIKSIFRGGIDNVFTAITGEINLYMKTDCPMVVEKTTDEYKIIYLIAPANE